MLARILTENKNYQDVVSLVSGFFPGATIIKADGLWHNVIEHSLVIEIDIGGSKGGSFAPEKMKNIIKLAYAIKKHNKQDAVLVQYLQCESRLV